MCAEGAVSCCATAAQQRALSVEATMRALLLYSALSALACCAVSLGTPQQSAVAAAAASPTATAAAPAPPGGALRTLVSAVQSASSLSVAWQALKRLDDLPFATYGQPGAYGPAWSKRRLLAVPRSQASSQETAAATTKAGGVNASLIPKVFPAVLYYPSVRAASNAHMHGRCLPCGSGRVCSDRGAVHLWRRCRAPTPQPAQRWLKRRPPLSR